MDVEVLEDTYRELVEANDCIAAIPAIVEFSEAANLASNLLRQGLEPFYDASRDARDSITRNRTLLNELVAAERMFNELLKQRNRAWVEEAKCLLEIGDREDAITRLYRALEFIDADSERGLWEEARRLLWAEVGYSPQE
jgi:tetratricopeptide (TPR) repeat protein